MKKERNKRIEIGLPEYILSYAKVTAKTRGMKLDQLIKEALERFLGIAPLYEPQGNEYATDAPGMVPPLPILDDTL